MELFYETPDRRAKLYLGDSRHLPIEDESIDMIATSPPYWGKRDYGEDVIAVWGGEDGCEHQWEADGGHLRVDSPWGEGGEGRLKKYDKKVEAKGERAYCSLCGAWRGQLGLEPTWQEYIAHLCECAEEWWRVLKPTGNLFVNIGDTFNTHTSKRSAQFDGDIEDGANLVYTMPRPRQNYPEKHKLGIPFRLRFALNDMGWVSRDDIPWYKGKEYPDGRVSKTAMPESVQRRFARSYEMVFRFVKTPKMNYYVNERMLESRDKPPSERIEGQDFEWREHARCEGKGCDNPRCKDGLIKYSFWDGVDQWFDLDAVRRPHQDTTIARAGRGLGMERYKGMPAYAGGGGINKPRTNAKNGGLAIPLPTAGANPGDVWIIQPEPFREKHYACWPSKLCEMMIKVGCPKEVCPKCGRPRERLKKTLAIEDHPLREDRNVRNVQFDGEGYSESEGTLGKVRIEETIGWSDCGCGEGFVPGVVVDPFFGGSWRLARVALNLGRNVIGIDMKEEYLEMAKDISIYGEKGLSKEKARRKEGATQGVLL